MAAGRPVGDEIVGALVLPLVDQAVPEWQAALDALLPLPCIGGPVGYSGGLISIGIRLAVVEPRVSAAVLFAGTGYRWSGRTWPTAAGGSSSDRDRRWPGRRSVSGAVPPVVPGRRVRRPV